MAWSGVISHARLFLFFIEQSRNPWKMLAERGTLGFRRTLVENYWSRLSVCLSDRAGLWPVSDNHRKSNLLKSSCDSLYQTLE